MFDCIRFSKLHFVLGFLFRAFLAVGLFPFSFLFCSTGTAWEVDVKWDGMGQYSTVLFMGLLFFGGLEALGRLILPKVLVVEMVAVVVSVCFIVSDEMR